MTLRERFRYVVENWNGPDRRPLWQIAILLPAYPVYGLCRWFVDFMDRHL